MDRPLPKGMNKNVIDLTKDKLRGKIITEFVALKPKTYSYLKDDEKDVKNAKGTKQCVIKRVLKFDDYKDCLFKNEITLNYNKNLKVKHIVYILKKSTKLY